MNSDDVAILKKGISELVIVTVEDVMVPKDPLLILRNSLVSGVLVIDGFVQEYDYLQATFGNPPPIGVQLITLSTDIYGCSDHERDLTGYIVVTTRGECSFLLKALLAENANASTVIVINNEHGRFRMPSMLGGDPTSPTPPYTPKIPLVMLTNSSLASINKGLTSDLKAALIPMKYIDHMSSPVLQEEKSVLANLV